MLRLLGDIAARLLGGAVQTTTGAVLRARAGVDLARRLRDTPDPLGDLQRAVEASKANAYTLTVERNFALTQLARAARGEEPICLAAIGMPCPRFGEAAEPCACCQLASRLRVPAQVPKTRGRRVRVEKN